MRLVQCLVMWIGFLSLCEASPHWRNTHFPSTFQYSSSDTWNGGKADIDSIVVQKDKDHIWIYNGRRWENTQFKMPEGSASIQDWNTATAKDNKIILYTNKIKFFIYDGHRWHRFAEPLPISYQNIKHVFFTTSQFEHSLLLISRNGQVVVYKKNGWHKVPIVLPAPIGSLNFLNSETILWTYANQDNVLIYQGTDVTDTHFSKLLNKNEDIAQSFLNSPNDILILTTSGNLWAYDGKKWKSIHNQPIKNKNVEFAISDSSKKDSIIILTGHKNSLTSTIEPSMLWNAIDIYNGKHWTNARIPLVKGEFIAEMNAAPTISSIVVMTNKSRVLLYEGEKWRDTKLMMDGNSLTNGDWNAMTADSKSIIVGVTDEEGRYFFMLYDGASWRKVGCSFCRSMDASYQKNINNLVVIDKNGQFFAYSPLKVQ